jgi:hypothetical protein
MASIQNPVQAVLTEAALTHQEREHEGQRGGVRHAGGASASERADALGVGSGRAAVGSGGRSAGGEREGVAAGMTFCPGGAAFSGNGGGGGGGGGAHPLQKGGHSISNATAKALNKATGKNLTAREWGRAVEELKRSEGLPPNSHGTIMSNGDYISANDFNMGNLTHYLP